MRIQTFLELLIFLILTLGAICAVPILHKFGRVYLPWASSVVLLAGIPLAIGLLWKRPPKSLTFIVLGMLSAVPVVAIASEELPRRMVRVSDDAQVYVSMNDMLWEGYLIAIASVLTFYSAAWLVALLRSRRWLWACFAHLGIVLGTFTVFATTWMLLFFE